MSRGTCMSRWRLAIVMLALTALKLVLVSHHEIIVRGFDDGGFARVGAVGYWGEPHGSEGFVRQPVYPVFLHWCSELRVPQRIAIELVWALACLILARGARACGVRPALALAVGALALFYPPTFIWFDRLAQDNLYAPLAMIFIASMAGVLARRSARAVWRWSALACIAGALAANTRPEAILLYGAIGVAAAVTILMWRVAGAAGSRRLTRRRLIAAVVLPVLAMQGLTIGLARANKAHFGVAVTTDFMLPGFKRLYNALLSIPPEPGAPGGGRDPRLPITRDVREKAYAVSPTFGVLRPWLDGEHAMREFARACERQTGVKGEFGAWTVWALRLAARRSHGKEPWPSAAPLDAFYARAADEIAAAQDDGRIGRRAVPISFVPPLWPELLSGWPASIRRSWNLVARVPYERAYSAPAAIKHRRDFDDAARRRPATRAIADRDSEGLARLEHSAWYNARRVRDLDRVKGGFVAAYRVIVPAALWGGVAGGLAGLAGAITRRRRRLARGWWILGAMTWSALVARVVLISLMDVTGLPILERYLLPCGPWLLVVAALGVQAVAACPLVKSNVRP